MCVSLLAPVCPVCVKSNQCTGKNHVIRVKPSVDLIPCSLLLVAHNTQGAAGTKVPRLRTFLVHNIIKQNKTLNVA